MRTKRQCPNDRNHYEIDPLYVRENKKFKPLEIREDSEGKEDCIGHYVRRGFYCKKCQKIVWVKEYDYKHRYSD